MEQAEYFGDNEAGRSCANKGYGDRSARELNPSALVMLHRQIRGILAHCRQYFDKAAKVTELPSGRSLARVALEDFLKQVYTMERKVKALRKNTEPSGIAPLAEILALRQKEAAPIMAAFKKWVDDLLPGVPPKTALGKALAYTVRQWEKVSRFLSDPEMPADNNYCENQIRPFAVGRAWLFVDSQLGAKASANLYSIVMTCRANGIEPYAYLCHLFEEFPKAKTAEQLEALLPWNAKATVDADAAQTDADSPPNLNAPQRT
jgi:hypothetical protein